MTNKLALRLGVGKPKPAVVATPAVPADDDSMSSLDMLANLQVDDIEEVRETSVNPMRNLMANESAIDAPLRDLATIDAWVAEAEALAESNSAESKKRLEEVANARQFVALLDGLYGYFDDPELMRGAISSIMIELKSNPQYINESDWDKSLVKPDDIRLWLQGMRESMGLVRIKKEKAKAKRSGGKAAASALDLSDELASLGISLDLD